MAWIEVHQNLIKHPKTTKAAEIAGMDRYKFIGHLICFWLWALDYADVEGHLPGNVSEKILTAAADVPLVRSKQWVKALVECGDENQAGFIEIIDGHFTVHDWRDFAGRLMEKRIANKERMYNARATHKPNTNNARAGATVPNPTIPNHISKDILPTPLPAWLNVELWKDFLEMRKKKRATPTEKAKELLIADLEKLRQAGDNPDEVLKQSIMRNYTGVFSTKKENNLYGNKKSETEPPTNIPGLTIEDFGK